MKPDYKNWVPNGMLAGFTAGTVLSAILLVLTAGTCIFHAQPSLY